MTKRGTSDITNPHLIEVLGERVRQRTDSLDLDSLEILETLATSGVQDIPSLGDLHTFGDLEDVCWHTTQ